MAVAEINDLLKKLYKYMKEIDCTEQKYVYYKLHDIDYQLYCIVSIYAYLECRSIGLYPEEAFYPVALIPDLPSIAVSLSSVGGRRRQAS